MFAKWPVNPLTRRVRKKRITNKGRNLWWCFFSDLFSMSGQSSPFSVAKTKKLFPYIYLLFKLLVCECPLPTKSFDAQGKVLECNANDCRFYCMQTATKVWCDINLIFVLTCYGKLFIMVTFLSSLYFLNDRFQ